MKVVTARLSWIGNSNATAPSSNAMRQAMRILEPDRPLRVGLYFPLLDAWREI